MPRYSPFPLVDFNNPFLVHFLYAMEEHDWQASPFLWKIPSLIRHRGKIPVILFHWPDSYWRSPSLQKRKRLALKFRFMVWLGKKLDYKFVWCAHNVLPHDRNFVHFEKKQHLWMLRTFDLVIGFARNTKEDLEKEYGSLRIPFAGGVHGHYEGLYPASASDEKLIKKFGLDRNKKKIFLLLSDKEYKGQDDFLDAWCQGHRNELQLVLAGRIPKSLAEKVNQLPGSIVHIGAQRRISHYELGDLHRACDIIAQPYRRITTSGSSLLAVTVKKPIFAPDLPFFCLHFGQGSALLYKAEKGIQGIRDGFERLAEGEWNPDPRELTKLRFELSWKNFARDIVPALNELSKSRPAHLRQL